MLTKGNIIFEQTLAGRGSFDVQTNTAANIDMFV